MRYSQVVVIPSDLVPVDASVEPPKRIGEILLEKAEELYPDCAEELKERIANGQVRISK